MNEVDVNQVLRLATSTYDGQSHICYLTDPKLRYLTKEQAEAWNKMTYSTIDEVQLVRNKLSEILKGVKAPITLVDLGCGDGRKAAHFIYLASQVGCPINRYLAIDVNNYMIETATSGVVNSTSLHREDCSSFCTPLENLAAHMAQYRLENSGSLIYLFFGNMFNVFEKDDIVHTLAQILQPHEKLLIGSDCRRTSDNNEAQQIVEADEVAYDNDFLSGVGRLLGVPDDNMHRVITYNSALHRLEVWFEIDHPSPSMVEIGLADVRRILVLCSYKPTLEEARESLSPYFNVTPFPNRDATEVVYLCERLVVPRILSNVTGS